VSIFSHFRHLTPLFDDELSADHGLSGVSRPVFPRRSSDLSLPPRHRDDSVPFSFDGAKSPAISSSAPSFSLQTPFFCRFCISAVSFSCHSIASSRTFVMDFFSSLIFEFLSASFGILFLLPPSAVINTSTYEKAVLSPPIGEEDLYLSPPLERDLPAPLPTEKRLPLFLELISELLYQSPLPSIVYRVQDRLRLFFFPFSLPSSFSPLFHARADSFRLKGFVLKDVTRNGRPPFFLACFPSFSLCVRGPLFFDTDRSESFL